jgi:hypothetical protein
MTALLLASEGGHAETVRVLVELGASVEAANKVNIRAHALTASVWDYEDDDHHRESCAWMYTCTYIHSYYTCIYIHSYVDMHVHT